MMQTQQGLHMTLGHAKTESVDRLKDLYQCIMSEGNLQVVA